MSNSVLKQLFIVFISSYLVACAGTPEEGGSLADEARSGRLDCISQMSIRDYQVLDDANLIVTGGGRRAYHVTLYQKAFGLRSTWRIGFKSTAGRACAGSAELIVDSGMGLETYRVRSIRELTPEEHDDLLVQFGKKEPEAGTGPAPEEVEGAEVEELD